MRDFDTKTGQLLVTMDPATFAQQQCLQADPTTAKEKLSWRLQVFLQKWGTIMVCANLALLAPPEEA